VGGREKWRADRLSTAPWCSVGLGQWPSRHGAQWLPFLAVVSQHALGSPGEGSSEVNHGAIPTARRMEEVAGGCARVAEDRLLLGAPPPAPLPPAPGGDVPTNSMLVASSLHWPFWLNWLLQAGESG